jgi:hypothetical protein
MPDPDPFEFYVGYRPVAPPGIAARTRRFVSACFVLAVLLGLALALGFGRLPLATFEFGHLRTFEGTLQTSPHPALFVERPGAFAGLPATSRYHLVGPAKFGADALVAGLDGRRVQLEGTLVHRDGQTLIELLPGSLRELGGAPLVLDGAVSLGAHVLVGEIVDSKCFLGVMRPGNLKPHRACAVRCISGGIPPVLCVRDLEGRAEYLLLVGEEGQPLNRAVLEYVALPIEITGDVERVGDQLVLRTSPSKFRVL